MDLVTWLPGFVAGLISIFAAWRSLKLREFNKRAPS